MEELERFVMIQDCIDANRKKRQGVNYLEIGVETGFCFFMIKAAKKLAVDPKFTIPYINKIKAYIRNPFNFRNKYFELTSDDFFEQQDEYIKTIGGLDVVFIDGLHLWEQVMEDIKNSLKVLNDDGVILVHDCNPENESSSIRAHTKMEVAAMNIPGYNHIWNGDVWKAIVALRATRPDINVKVIDTDQGVGIITKQSPENQLDLKIEEIEKLTYQDLANDRIGLLNLKPANEFYNFTKLYAGAEARSVEKT